MTKINHLHTSLTEPLSTYRQCDVQTILTQMSPEVTSLVSGGVHKRIVSVDKEGEYTPVGVLLPMEDNLAVRVLYTYFDFYEVQQIKIDGDKMTINMAFDGVDAMHLGLAVLEASVPEEQE